MTCGEEVKQRINGVIKYLPLGSEAIEEEHGTYKEAFIWSFQLQEKET